MKTQKYLSLFVAMMLAFFSFAISYNALESLAEGQGIEPASLFPVIIDGVLILCLLFRLYGSEKELAQLIMLSYVCLSVALNAVSHGNILGAIMAAVAPISMLVSSEIAASMINTRQTPGTRRRDEKGRFVKQTEVVNE